MRKLFKSILPHVVAWVLAYTFYAIIIFFVFLDGNEANNIRSFGLLQIVIWGVYVGIFIGILLGLIDQFFLKKIISSKRSIGFVILLKSFIYSFTIFITILVGAATWVSIYGNETFIEKLLHSKFRFASTFIYSVFVTVLINFISQVNRKFGPGNIASDVFRKIPPAKSRRAYFYVFGFERFHSLC